MSEQKTTTVICNPLSNNICLGEIDEAKQAIVGIGADVTSACVKAVMRHLNNKIPPNETTIAFKCEAGTLLWERKV